MKQGRHGLEQYACVQILLVLVGATLANSTLNAQPTLQQRIDKAVLVESVKVDYDHMTDGHFPVEVRLRNTSPQPIYAVTWAVTAKYADGSSKTQSSGYDLADRYLAGDEREKPAHPEQIKPFRSGDDFAATMTLMGPRPTGVECRISLVEFEDRTVLGSKEEIQKLIHGRNVAITRLSEILGDIKAADGAQDPVKGLADRRSAILAEAAANGDKRVTRVGPSTVTTLLSYRAAYLANLSASAHGDKDILKAIIALQMRHYEAHLKVLTTHSVLQEAAQ